MKAQTPILGTQAGEGAASESHTVSTSSRPEDLRDLKYFQARLEGAAEVAMTFYVRLSATILGCEIGAVIVTCITHKWANLWFIPAGIAVQALCFVLWRKIMNGTYGSLENYDRALRGTLR